LTLRLAFSYFLIGVVPIPLLAMLAFTVAYVLAHQFMATRVRREVTAVAQEMAALGKASSLHLLGDTVEASDLPWLKPGDKAAWAASLDAPRPVIADGDIWIAMRRAREDPQAVLLVKAGDPEFLRRLADESGFQPESGQGRVHPRSKSPAAVGPGREQPARRRVDGRHLRGQGGFQHDTLGRR